MSKDETKKPYLHPLVIISSILSTASLIWTATSMYDLLHSDGMFTFGGVDIASLAVALATDLIWAGILIAEWKQYRLGWHRTEMVPNESPIVVQGDDGEWVEKNKWIKETNQVNLVPLIGWLALACVVTLLVWHGIAINNMAAALGGSLIPVFAKIMWLLSISAHRDPTEFTQDQQKAIDNMKRDTAYQAELDACGRSRVSAQHEAYVESLKLNNHKEATKIRLNGDLQTERDNANFSVWLNREEKKEEMRRRTPILGEVLRRPELGDGEDPDLPPPPRPTRRTRSEGENVSLGQPSESNETTSSDMDWDSAFPTSEEPTPMASFGESKKSFTVKTDGTDELQRKRISTAAEYYALKSLGYKVSQKKFADSKGFSASTMTRILQEYPQKDILNEDFEEAKERVENRKGKGMAV